ncbi:MAG: ATP-binding protein [Acidobacteria bacterium]|nr:ATP-binding protein [Acidobacteriota bacterium]
MQRRILIVDDHNGLAGSLGEAFGQMGHFVRTIHSRSEAAAVDDIESFDLLISNLDVANEQPTQSVCTSPSSCPACSTLIGDREQATIFKLCATNFRRAEFDEDEVCKLVATVLEHKLRSAGTCSTPNSVREYIEFELPSVIGLMHTVLEYLMRRVETRGLTNPERSNLFVALDEAFVNAVKHGNKYDPTKLVRLAASISSTEARFVVEDQGEGFNVKAIADPLDPENLFKTSGRGVLFIHNIMDEVTYNERGNRLTMVKRGDTVTLDKA